MKRTNVILDEELLEKARRVSGEKTYSATINKALEDLVRRDRFRESLKKFEEVARTEGIFEPEYIREKLANSLSQEKTRISAHEARVSRSSRKRGSR